MAKDSKTSNKDHRKDPRKRQYQLAEIHKFLADLTEQQSKLDGFVARMEREGIQKIKVRGVATMKNAILDVNRFVANLASALERVNDDDDEDQGAA